MTKLFNIALVVCLYIGLSIPLIAFFTTAYVLVYETLTTSMKIWGLIVLSLSLIGSFIIYAPFCVLVYDWLKEKQQK